MEELESWNAWNAFSALQTSARNFAGLNNARALIGEVKKIRHLCYAQLAEEWKREQFRAEESQENLQKCETVSVNIDGGATGQGMMLYGESQQAA